MQQRYSKAFSGRRVRLATWLLAGLVAAPAVALADAESSNTLSLTLSYSPRVNNTFGYSTLAAFAVNGGAPPATNPGSLRNNPAAASSTISVPQDVVSVFPDNAASQSTAASFQLLLENLTGSGGSSLPANPFNPNLTASVTYDLNDSLVDMPPLDEAASSYFVYIYVNGVLAASSTLSATDPQHLTGTVPLAIPAFMLPANSVTRVIALLSLDAAASSYRPPSPPLTPPPIPPIPHIYPSLPEPSTWAMLLLGLGSAGAALRAARRGRLAQTA
jgi:hypothetical protein